MCTFKCWEVSYKEVGSDKVRKTKHLGHLTEVEVIKFFGLDGDDVTWYEIKEVNI